METPRWFEPFKKMIINLFDAIFGEKPELLKETISRVPLLGDKGDHVKTLQMQLNEFGHGLMLDGDFGPKTRRAVSEFQKSKGLAGSGVIGPKTLEFLSIEVVVPEGNSVREKVWNIVNAELGVTEIPGPRHNPRILEYHATTGGFSDDETPWCSSLMNWAMIQAGLKGTNSAAARSWMQWGVPTTNPKKGDVVVFWRVRRDSWQGHVGLYSHETPTHILVLGGNQGSTVNVSAYSKNQLLGYRTYQ